MVISFNSKCAVNRSYYASSMDVKRASNQTPKAIAQPQLTFKQVLNIARKHKPFWWLALGFWYVASKLSFGCSPTRLFNRPRL